MRPERRRTKKLIVAFHFQYANQAGWKCDVCRRQGLESRRRCAWLPGQESGIVWARGRVRTGRCPKSSITAASVRWIEEFYAWKISGKLDFLKLRAKTAEAFLVLEQEWRAEQNEQRNRK